MNGTPSGSIVADCLANSRHNQIDALDSDFTRVTSYGVSLRRGLICYVMATFLSNCSIRFRYVAQVIERIPYDINFSVSVIASDAIKAAKDRTWCYNVILRNTDVTKQGADTKEMKKAKRKLREENSSAE